jgi:riboflavin synthase
VQGHVDGVGEVARVEPHEDGGATFTVRVPEALARYVVEKGSIAVDGVSLTVAVFSDEGVVLVSVALIPHTLAATTLGTAKPGDPVNLEVDVIAKYVERFTAPTSAGRSDGGAARGSAGGSAGTTAGGSAGASEGREP